MQQQSSPTEYITPLAEEKQLHGSRSPASTQCFHSPSGAAQGSFGAGGGAESLWERKSITLTLLGGGSSHAARPQDASLELGESRAAGGGVPSCGAVGGHGG